MKPPFKGTDTTPVGFSEAALDLLRLTFNSDQLSVTGELVELVVAIDAKIASAPAGPITFSHDELAVIHSTCKKTLYAKNRRIDAAELMHTVRAGFESFYKE